MSTALGSLALASLAEPGFSLRVERAEDQAALLSLAVAGVVGCWLRAVTTTGRTPSRTGTPLPNFWWLGSFVAANLVAAGLGQGLRLIPGVSITFWPPAGLFVAALLLTDRARWPWWVGAAGVAELAGNALWFHNPWHLAVLYFAANTAVAMTAAVLVRRAVGGASRFVSLSRLEAPRNAALFAVLAGIVAPVVGATLIATADAVLGKHAFWTAWPLVWLGDGTGLLLSAPLTLAAAHAWRHRGRIRVERAVEFAATCGLTLLVAWLALRGLLPTVYLTLPAVVWVAVRFQLRGAWAVLTAVVLTVAAFTRSGLGEFAGTPDQMRQQVVALQAFLGVCALTALVVAGLSTQYVRALAKLRAANQSLEQRILARTAAVRESEGRFRLAADAVNGIIYEYDFATGHVERSRGVTEVLGYPPDEVPPTAGWWAEQIHPDDRGRVTAIGLDAVRGNSTLTEYRVRRKDGRWLHVEDRAVLVRDARGQPVKMVGCTVDVTERKKAEEQLLDRERFVQRILAASPGVVYLFDLAERRTAFINERVKTTLGVTPEQVVAAGERFMADHVHPDDLPALRGHTERVSALADGELLSTEYRMRHADGRWVWFASRDVVFARTPDGRPSQVLGVAADITELKRAEEQVRASEERFRVAIGGSPVMVYTCDRNLRYEWIYNNPGRFTQPDVIGKRDDEILPAELAAELVDFKSAVLASGVGGRREVRFPFDHGIEYYDVTAEPLRDESGAVIGLTVAAMETTDRKRAEEKIRDSERRLAAILDQLPVGVSVTDPDGRVTLTNPVMRRFVPDRIPSLDPDRQRRWRAWGPDGSPLPTDQWPGQRAMRGEGVVPGVEFLFTDDDGREVWTSVAATPLRDDGSAVAGAVVVIQDIDHRKQAEEQLRASEAFARQVSDVAPSILYVYDLDEKRNVWANRETFAGLGYTREQLDAMSGDLLGSLLHPDDLAPYRGHAARLTGLAEGEAVEFEYRMRAADGSWRWLASRDMAFRRGDGGRVTQIIGAALDITARRRAEEQLRFQFDLTRNITDNATTAIFMMDDRSRCTFMNPAAERMTGFAFAEVEGGVLHDFIHHHRPDGRPYPMPDCPIDRALPEGGEVRDHEDVFFRKNGEKFPVCCNARVIYKEGVAVETVIEVRDISDQQRAEQEREELVRQLRQADARKDEFLATLAHELRNPLAPIQNGVQIIRMSGPNGAVGKTLDTMDRQLGHLVHLIDDLLDVSRITRGKLHLRRERVTLQSAVEAAVEAVMPLVAKNRHELTVMPVPAAWLDGDPTRLAQIFSNLLTNAAKYTHRGGRITLAARADGGEVVVSVRDTGIGIPPVMLSRVFELFSQVDRALEKTTGGLGIGLSLVKGLVEMHGGTISAHSEGEGSGSEFTVRLPATAGDTGEGQPMSGTTLPATGRLTVLVVDDNEDAAESMATMLGLYGHEVRTAFDGEAGVAEAEAFRPRVAFLDIGMPKVNGYDAARRIRAEGWGKDVLLVALTGWGSDDDKRKCEEAGFDHHLTKPVNPQALTDLLNGLTPATV